MGNASTSAKENCKCDDTQMTSEPRNTNQINIPNESQSSDKTPTSSRKNMELPLAGNTGTDDISKDKMVLSMKDINWVINHTDFQAIYMPHLSGLYVMNRMSLEEK